MKRKLARLLLVGVFLSGLFAIHTRLLAQESFEESAAEATEEIEEEEGELTIWKWANFALLAIGLGIMLGKALPKAFAERTEAIQKDIKESTALKADAEKRAAAVEARVASLGADIESFKAEAGQIMASEGDRIRQETTAQIKRVEEQAGVEIDTAGKIARRELRQYSAELALKLAEERVRMRMDAGTESDLVDGFVTELSRQKAASQEMTN